MGRSLVAYRNPTLRNSITGFVPTDVGDEREAESVMGLSGLRIGQNGMIKRSASPLGQSKDIGKQPNVYDIIKANQAERVNP
jgi:hypothetical protein